MNLYQLYYFKKVAELQHYTQAAKELYVTEPTLSASIAALESELGVHLFEKVGRSVKLTKYGVEFLQYVSSALQVLDNGITQAKEFICDTGGVIEVGCLVTLLGDFLPLAICRYHDAVSKATKFNTYSSATTRTVVDGLKTGRFDVAFGSKLPDEPDIDFYPLYPEKFIALVNKQHPLASMGKVFLDDLQGYRIITYSKKIPNATELEPLIKLHQLDVHCEYKYLEEISLGGYVSIQPVVALVAETPLLNQFTNLVHLEIVDIPKDHRYLYMSYHKKGYLSRPAERFIQFIRDNTVELTP